MVLFHTVHVHSYWYTHGISILLGLGTPLIILLLCAISPLSSQGTKTRTCNMANSAAIALCFTKMADVIMQVGHCGRTRYKYSWGCSIQEMGGNVVIGRSIYGVVVIDELLQHTKRHKSVVLVL